MNHFIYKGQQIRFSKLAEVFCKWYDDAMQPKSKHFRLRKYREADREFDFTWLTDEDVYRVLKMPKIGKKMGFGEFQMHMIRTVDYDKNGNFLGFESSLLDYIAWAQSQEIYIAFEEGELIIIGQENLQ